MINDSLIVDDRHFEYLKIQKGRLDCFIHDRETWHRVYERDLRTTYAEMKPHLPARCWGILDVGSGLGGIDILLSRHYKGKVQVTLMDGEKDEPRMLVHRQTFNDMGVALDFHLRNGVESDHFSYCTPACPRWDRAYALVISFGSWCFHYSPETYLDRLMATAIDKDTVLILDVRKSHVDWHKTLNKALAARHVIRDSEKFQRIVYGVR